MKYKHYIQHCDSPTEHRLYFVIGGYCPCIEPCNMCNSMLDLRFAPDPYAEEINYDDTPVWECDACRHESAQDI